MKKTITLCFILFAFLAKAQVTLHLTFFGQCYYIGSGQSFTSPDSTTVDLVDSANCNSVVATYKGLFFSDGTMICTYSSSIIGHHYYIRISHCPFIRTMCAQPYLFASVGNTYDFTTAATQAYCSNEVLVDVSPDVYAFYCGDLNQDGNVDLIDFPTLDTAINNGICTANCADINGDGNVDLLDYPTLCQGINSGSFGCLCQP